MVESGDAAKVRHEFKTIYGFDVSDQFANDFIAFVEKMTSGT